MTTIMPEAPMPGREAAQASRRPIATSATTSLRLVAEGLSNGEVDERLVVSEETVRLT